MAMAASVTKLRFCSLPSPAISVIPTAIMNFTRKIKKGKDTIEYGKYTSIWKRQKDGS
jgi:hypothetical protein